MLDMNKTAIGIAAGVAGTLFIGYCIYFDKKRRNDPEYKKKVRERRRRSKKSGPSKAGIPNLNDHEAIEKYFLQEIQLGETLIARGDYETGVEHLANAIVVCGQPARLLQVLQSSLPAQVFAMLIVKMQEFGNRSAESNDVGVKMETKIIDSSSVAGIDDLE
ncbi:mitochondrial import receptor subunit TOM20 homolog B [Drosophila guanche]|uniref:Blast:Mitochondrial import receptor subunit TOM20 homolog B n=1 Tax=Drosophila guanche TaxID=7266 RepID=A0A3B0K215_DROGU|nr:mitochondrial import receptor subunit TOM20 homolog B [Drosophila guanche]SPP87363.1 blast:Mitochondrial import receptor subunit TOM20 homolog B [Drosophila guanche]